MKNYKQILENAKGMIEATKTSTGKLKDACWKGFTAVGTKTKGGRTVPNCVPIKDSVEIDGESIEEMIANAKNLLVELQTPERRDEMEKTIKILRGKAKEKTQKWAEHDDESFPSRTSKIGDEYVAAINKLEAMFTKQQTERKSKTVYGLGGNIVKKVDGKPIQEVKYKPMPGTLNYGVNGDDLSRYMGAAKPLMQRKTDARGNLIKQPKRDMSGMTTSAAVKMAKDLIKTLTQKAPNNTSIEVIGSSGGKTYSFYIRRGKISGQDVWVAEKSGNKVELNAAGTGLQVVDAKTHRIILDRGTDVYWN